MVPLPQNSGVEFTQTFTDSYQRLPQVIQNKVSRQLSYLAEDITHPGLHARKMTDMKGIYEARVDARYRFTFELLGSSIRLRDIGTHKIFARP